MTLQDIIDHLSAVVADMNENSEHDLALKAQFALVMVDALQSACTEYGSVDGQLIGDWTLNSTSSEQRNHG